MIKGAIFDLDHTLFDRYATLRAVLPEMYKRLRDKIPQDLSCEDFIENLIKMEKLHIYHGWEYTGEKLVQAGVFLEGTTGEDIWQCLFRHCWPLAAVEFPFTKPMLKRLREMGLKVGLITNGSVCNQSIKLDLMDMWSFFDEVIICDDQKYPAKPHPAAFKAMSEKLGCPPESLLYVGDNPFNDVLGARAGGFVPVWVKTIGIWPEETIERAPYEVNDVSEIPDLVQKINSL